MATGKPLADYAAQFNSTYNITVDLSGWDKTTIEIVPPLSGAINIYATNDSGAVQGVTQGNAQLATNFVQVQATDLTSGSPVTSISAAGLYKYEVNAQFLSLQGNPASAGTNVYKLLLFNSKIF